jgi:hypothetical protein
MRRPFNFASLNGVLFSFLIANAWGGDSAHPPAPPVREREATATIFASKDWDSGEEEILKYRITRSYRGVVSEWQADWRTGLVWFRDGHYETKRPKVSGFEPRMMSQLRIAGEAEGRPWAAQVAWNLDRVYPFQSFMQATSVQGLKGPAAQMLIAEGQGKIEIKTQAFGRKVEAPRREWPAPLFTPEGLFLWVRTLPTSSQGWEREIWLMDSPLEDTPKDEPLYAKVTPTPRRELIRELETRHIQVQRSDGKRWEFWIQAGSRSALVKIKTPDGSTWELMEMRRAKPLGF